MEIIRDTYPMRDGSKKTVYSPNTAPEKFYSDVVKIKTHGSSEKPPDGHVFIWDHRIKDEFQRWAKPTELAENLALEYPLGGGSISSMEIIQWKDGNVLTLISVDSDLEGFKFTFWAGLNITQE